MITNSKKWLEILICLFTLYCLLFNAPFLTGHGESTEELSCSYLWIPSVSSNNGSLMSGFGSSSNMATRGMEIFNDELYVGTENLDIARLSFLNLRLLMACGVLSYDFFELVSLHRVFLTNINIVVPLHGLFGEGCEVWRYNASLDSWSPLVSHVDGSLLDSGFGFRGNFAASVLKEFKGALYIGTGTSSLSGCELWRWDGESCERVVKGGFGDRFNSGMWCIAEYRDALYIGTMNWREGCQLWRSDDGVSWEHMVLPGGDGFGTSWNVYAWSMGVYDDDLFVGTCNTNPEVGGQLWRYNGSQWMKMDLPGGDGFGNPDNYGIRNIVEFNNDLYVSTATNYMRTKMGCEIWRYDGREWHVVIGEKGILSDGFGDVYNKYAWSMMITSENRLLVGTMNLQHLVDYIPFNTYGCELWSFDGTDWEILIGEGGHDGFSGGFNDRLNVGARSMIEYPVGSDVVWVGTWNMDFRNFETFHGCELWKRVKP